MKMREKLNQEKKIVLYGAGAIAHNIYRALILSGYTIAYCVISNENVSASEFETVKVYSFKEKKEEIIQNGYQIVIATVFRYEKEIIRNIENSGIQKFWKKNELPWNHNPEIFDKFDEKEYMNMIEKKYFSNKDKYEKEIRVRNYFEKNKRKKRNNNKVTFLLMDGSSRAYKIIEALHRKGYAIELIIWVNAARFGVEKNREFEKISDECRVCTDVEEVMMYYATTDSKILHIFFCHWSDIELPQILMKCKKNINYLPNIIFDAYDIYVDINQMTTPQMTEAELFCLSNADGLCNRYRNMEALEKRGYNICKKRIHFIDCCNDFTRYESKEKSEDEELHLVYAGTVFGDAIYQRLKAGRYLEYGLRCEKNKVHLHIYPSSYDEERLHQYIDMEKNNTYFHMHHPVPYTQLLKEISQYDYGITSGMRDFLGEKNEKGVYEREDWIYAETSKYYDYLDAGLPIIAPLPIKQIEMLEKDGVLIRKVDEEIDFEELRIKRNVMKKRVLAMREKYRISNQLPTLIEFYNSF